MHILLIDDSSSTRSLLRTLINSGQAVRHEISEPASGEEALQKIESGEIRMPDLIIMDINMGGMSGYELCREFRQRHGSTSDLMPYIIIVTANEGIDVINQALESGANDYMPKPVNVKVLQVRLRVAERLLSQIHTGAGAAPAAPVATPEPTSAPSPAPDSTPANSPITATGPMSMSAPVNSRQSMIADAIEQIDAPLALVDVVDTERSFTITYSNTAMTTTTGATSEQLLGQSLSDLEAWTPEFLKMVLGFVGRSGVLSHVPMWSKTKQEFQVYLSFYPVRVGDEPAKQYLVIHHL